MVHYSQTKTGGDAAANEPLRIMAIGAHPDDCEIRCGGTGALWARQGHKVLFVSMTNGQSGHHEMAGPALVHCRITEARSAAAAGGIESHILPLPDGYLEPTLANRMMLIRLIRKFRADLVVTNRPTDYHPDHRYTSQLVQDAAFLLTVPTIAPDMPALRRNPVILYWRDCFEKPIAFAANIAVNIDSVWDVKVRMVHEHASQVYGFLPWLEGILDEVPGDEATRLEWLERTLLASWDTPSTAAVYRDLLVERYGRELGGAAVHAEAFERCEYGGVFDEVTRERLFEGM